jgi:hypothetical protein
MPRQPNADKVIAKLRAYVHMGGFAVQGIEADDFGPERRRYILVRPTGGSLMRLTPREADIFLSGYLAHRRHTEQQGATQ